MSDSANAAMLEGLQKRALSVGIHEAFFEAGPQFVLQLSIILRLGYYSEYSSIMIITEQKL